MFIQHYYYFELMLSTVSLNKKIYGFSASICLGNGGRLTCELVSRVKSQTIYNFCLNTHKELQTQMPWEPGKGHELRELGQI